MPVPIGTYSRATTRPARPQLGSTIVDPAAARRASTDATGGILLPDEYRNTPGLDDYLSSWNAALPAAGADIARNLAIANRDLAQSRDAAAGAAAAAPGQFTEHQALAQSGLANASSAASGALSPDVAVDPNLLPTLQANIDRTAAASQAQVPKVQGAIGQAFAETNRRLQEEFGIDMDNANYERAMQVLGFATDQVCTDQARRDQFLAQRQEQSQQIAAEARAGRRATQEREAAFQDQIRLARETALTDAGWDRGVEDFERTTSSDRYREAVRYLTKGRQGVRKPNFWEQSTRPIWQRNDLVNTSEKFNPDKIAKEYGPTIVQAMIADGYLVLGEDGKLHKGPLAAG